MVIKKMAAAAVFLSGTPRLGKGILVNIRNIFETHKVKEAGLKAKTDEAYREMV